MAFDRWIIAPFNTGLETDLKSWLLPEDGFAVLTNAYVWRGRVRKRFGSYLMGTAADSAVTQQLFSRLRIQLASTGGTGNTAGTAPGTLFKVGQIFSIGDTIFTVNVAGTPATMLRTDGSPATATFNTSTGAYVIDGAIASTIVYFYPAEPVMGITTFDVGPINQRPTYAFDTQFAYVFVGFWLEIGPTGSQWHGNDTNFFWCTNWIGNVPGQTVLFVSNFQAAIGTPAPTTDDPIWSYDGTTWVKLIPYFLPAGGAPMTGPFVVTARIVLPFKDRLILLNTIEQNSAGTLNTQFGNRCRFSIAGSPFAVNSWYEPNQVDSSGNMAGGAGFIDAATDEVIVSAEFIKNRLIVYFERSTYELVDTQSEVQPFVWQKINTELGSEGTFSTVPFDKEVLTIGQTGVHSCNGANVQRIDVKIPNTIFTFQDTATGADRVFGIRDYFVEMVYWTFRSTKQLAFQNFPGSLLVYNYVNGSWSMNEDCITAFGYFEQQTTMTWATSPFTWETADFTWDSGTTQANFRQVIAGNPEGFMFIIAPAVTSNAPNMQITNMTVGGPTVLLEIVDHTMNVGQYVQVLNAIGVTGINNSIYPIVQVLDENNIVIEPATFTGVYLGGGTVRRVSNYAILSKRWNPYVDKGRNFYVAHMDFGVQKTSSGQVTVDYAVSSSKFLEVNQATETGTIVGNNILETSPYALVPREKVQDLLWHPIYFQGDGEFVQIEIYMSNEQIIQPAIAFSDFQIEAIIMHTTPTSYRLQ
jgi:hypothetical protein